MDFDIEMKESEDIFQIECQCKGGESCNRIKHKENHNCDILVNIRPNDRHYVCKGCRYLKKTKKTKKAKKENTVTVTPPLSPPPIENNAKKRKHGSISTVTTEHASDAQIEDLHVSSQPWTPSQTISPTLLSTRQPIVSSSHPNDALLFHGFTRSVVHVPGLERPQVLLLRTNISNITI